MMSSRLAALSALAALAVAPSAFAAAAPVGPPAGASTAAPPGFKLPNFADLPDWSGQWSRTGGNLFDASRAGAGNPGVRTFPPYTPAWEAKYKGYQEKVAQDAFPDPVSTCSIPSGMPRVFAIPDAIEFVVRPEQSWILTENGPNVVRIYTDGRGHSAPDEVWTTYTGDNIGHWEGDTLVIDSIAMKGDGDAILDRSGTTISDKAHVVSRLRKIDEKTMEVKMVITDPVALTKPWEVTRRFIKMPAGSRAYDYVCAENNRNPVDASGRTLTLDTSGRTIDGTK